MRKICGVLCAVVIAMSISPITVMAASTLDDVITNNEQTENQQPVEEIPSNNTQQTGGTTNPSDIGGLYQQNGAMIDDIQSASELDEPSSGASKVNQGIKKVASFIINIAAYATTILMTARVVLDLLYIAVPFSRSILANGYGGQAMGGQAGMGQPGMGGMGSMGMGGMGMGMGGMGMNRGMGMGMGMNRGMGMGMGGMQQGSQPGATPAMGRIQWISTAALNAVASEQVPGPDGRAQSPLKMYAKDMTVILVITPIMLVLAVSGVLVNLGFMLGDLLTRAISGLGNMF